MIQIITHTKKQKLMTFYKEQNGTISHTNKEETIQVLSILRLPVNEKGKSQLMIKLPD